MTEENSTLPRVQFTGDGETKEFGFFFKIFEPGNIRVFFGGEEQGSGFAVSFAGGGYSGGAVVFDQAPAAGTLVILARDVELKRTTLFTESQLFKTEMLNQEFDYQLACMEQFADLFSRTMVFPINLPEGVDMSLPFPAAGKALMWNADGSRLITSQVDIEDLNASIAAVAATKQTVEGLASIAEGAMDSARAAAASLINAMPLGERVKVFGHLVGSNLVGKLEQGLPIDSSNASALCEMLEADYQAGTESSETISGVNYAFVLGGTMGKRYYAQADYNARLAATGYSGGFVRVSEGVFVLPQENTSASAPDKVKAIPDYSAFTPITASPFTAPSAGYIQFSGGSATAYVNGVDIKANGGGDAAGPRSILVGKGDVFTFGTSAFAAFIPFKNIQEPPYTYYYQVSGAVSDPEQIIDAQALANIAALQAEQAKTAGIDDYVIEYQSGITGTGYTNGWYRKYKSGWIEQGGSCVSGRNQSVVFPAIFATNTYTIVTGNAFTASGSTTMPGVASRLTGSMVIGGDLAFDWIVSGR